MLGFYLVESHDLYERSNKLTENVKYGASFSVLLNAAYSATAEVLAEGRQERRTGTVSSAFQNAVRLSLDTAQENVSDCLKCRIIDGTLDSADFATERLVSVTVMDAVGRKLGL